MNKKAIKFIMSAFLAMTMIVQCAAFAAAKTNASVYYFECYFLYKGVYYSRLSDATYAAGGNSDAAERVINTNVPERCNEKWIDPLTLKLYASEREAEVYYGVLDAQLVWVDPNYKGDALTVDVNGTIIENSGDNSAASNSTTTDAAKTDDSTKAKADEDKKPAPKAVKVAEGTPYQTTKKSVSGWAKIADKLNSQKSGTYSITMNGCETIDKSVFEAIKDKNVTVNFKTSGGYTWAVKGTNVTSPADITPSVELNTKTISSKLIKTVSADAVSTTQLTLSDTEDSFGAKATIQIKFNQKRAGLEATVYRYDSETETLKKVCTSTVKDNGACVFNAKDGGSYLVILK